MATALVSDEQMMLTFFPGWPDLPPKALVFSNLNPFYVMFCILPAFGFIFMHTSLRFLKSVDKTSSAGV
jgi:hypothetical protein